MKDTVQPTHRIEYYDTISGQTVKTMTIEAESREAAVAKAYNFAEEIYHFSPDVAVR